MIFDSDVHGLGGGHLLLLALRFSLLAAEGVQHILSPGEHTLLNEQLGVY